MTLETHEAVRRAALDLLARREHSLVELRRKLARRVEDAELLESVLGALSAEGLASDERFAQSLVRSLVNRGKGPLAVRAALGKCGIDQALAELTIEAIDADWAALARQARVKRFGATPPAEHRERARQARFLQYRGFTAGQIAEALGDG